LFEQDIGYFKGSMDKGNESVDVSHFDKAE
jgi:hypothetical protein